FAAGVALGGGYYGSDYYDNGYYADQDYGYDTGTVAVESDTGVDPSYCAQRYRSYDPASGTYLGYDGLRHPCP
ncbi:MAG TPA: BA14K family protein, partial [Nevskia sp.]|nr:BA14K family protein [Nevskia sp.]